MPISAVIVVAQAAPTNSYLGMRMIFNMISIATRGKAIPRATIGFPLPIIVFASTMKTVKKVSPKTKILSESAASIYSEEYTKEIKFSEVALIRRTPGINSISMYLIDWLIYLVVRWKSFDDVDLDIEGSRAKASPRKIKYGTLASVFAEV